MYVLLYAFPKSSTTHVTGNILRELFMHMALVDPQPRRVDVCLPADVAVVVEPHLRLILRHTLRRKH